MYFPRQVELSKKYSSIKQQSSSDSSGRFNNLFPSFPASYVCYLSGEVVLRPVAGAHELVLCLVPRDDTSQVGAHRNNPVVLNLLVLRYHQVSGVALGGEGGGGGGGG